MEDNIKVQVYGDISFAFKMTERGNDKFLLEKNEWIERFKEQFQNEMEYNFNYEEGDFVKIESFKLTREVESMND